MTVKTMASGKVELRFDNGENVAIFPQSGKIIVWHRDKVETLGADAFADFIHQISRTPPRNAK